jgi:hypothetical protein
VERASRNDLMKESIYIMSGHENSSLCAGTQDYYGRRILASEKVCPRWHLRQQIRKLSNVRFAPFPPFRPELLRLLHQGWRPSPLRFPSTPIPSPSNFNPPDGPNREEQGGCRRAGGAERQQHIVYLFKMRTFSSSLRSSHIPHPAL